MQNEEGFLQEGMVNNTGVPVDPENEAYEMPPEVNLLWHGCARKRRAQEGAACSSHMSLADAGSCKGTAETWSLWPRSARGIVLGIRK